MYVGCLIVYPLSRGEALFILDVSASYVEHRILHRLYNTHRLIHHKPNVWIPLSPLRFEVIIVFSSRWEILKGEGNYQIRSLKPHPPSSLLAFPSARCFSLPVIAWGIETQVTVLNIWPHRPLLPSSAISFRIVAHYPSSLRRKINKGRKSKSYTPSPPDMSSSSPSSSCPSPP